MTKLWTIAAVGASCALSGCVAAADVAGSWRGVPADSLILSWGPPTRESRLDSGGRVIAYSETFNRFATRPDCTVTFNVNADGIITGGTWNAETIGACDVMLAGKPRAAQ